MRKFMAMIFQILLPLFLSISLCVNACYIELYEYDPSITIEDEFNEDNFLYNLTETQVNYIEDEPER
jgi:hypothetical protein